MTREELLQQALQEQQSGSSLINQEAAPQGAPVEEEGSGFFNQVGAGVSAGGERLGSRLNAALSELGSAGGDEDYSRYRKAKALEHITRAQQEEKDLGMVGQVASMATQAVPEIASMFIPGSAPIRAAAAFGSGAASEYGDILVRQQEMGQDYNSAGAAPAAIGAGIFDATIGRVLPTKATPFLARQAGNIAGEGASGAGHTIASNLAVGNDWDQDLGMGVAGSVVAGRSLAGISKAMEIPFNKGGESSVQEQSRVQNKYGVRMNDEMMDNMTEYENVNYNQYERMNSATTPEELNAAISENIKFTKEKGMYSAGLDAVDLLGDVDLNQSSLNFNLDGSASHLNFGEAALGLNKSKMEEVGREISKGRGTIFNQGKAQDRMETAASYNRHIQEKGKAALGKARGIYDTNISIAMEAAARAKVEGKGEMATQLTKSLGALKGTMDSNIGGHKIDNFDAIENYSKMAMEAAADLGILNELKGVNGSFNPMKDIYTVSSMEKILTKTFPGFHQSIDATRGEKRSSWTSGDIMLGIGGGIPAVAAKKTAEGAVGLIGGLRSQRKIRNAKEEGLSLRESLTSARELAQRPAQRSSQVETELSAGNLSGAASSSVAALEADGIVTTPIDSQVQPIIDTSIAESTVNIPEYNAPQLDQQANAQRYKYLDAINKKEGVDPRITMQAFQELGIEPGSPMNVGDVIRKQDEIITRNNAGVGSGPQLGTAAPRQEVAITEEAPIITQESTVVTPEPLIETTPRISATDMSTSPRQPQVAEPEIMSSEELVSRALPDQNILRQPMRPEQTPNGFVEEPRSQAFEDIQSQEIVSETQTVSATVIDAVNNLPSSTPFVEKVDVIGDNLEAQGIEVSNPQIESMINQVEGYTSNLDRAASIALARKPQASQAELVADTKVELEAMGKAADDAEIKEAIDFRAVNGPTRTPQDIANAKAEQDAQAEEALLAREAEEAEINLTPEQGAGMLAEEDLVKKGMFRNMPTPKKIEAQKAEIQELVDRGIEPEQAFNQIMSEEKPLTRYLHIKKPSDKEVQAMMDEGIDPAVAEDAAIVRKLVDTRLIAKFPDKFKDGNVNEKMVSEVIEEFKEDLPIELDMTDTAAAAVVNDRIKFYVDKAPVKAEAKKAPSEVVVEEVSPAQVTGSTSKPVPVFSETPAQKRANIKRDEAEKVLAEADVINKAQAESDAQVQRDAALATSKDIESVKTHATSLINRLPKSKVESGLTEAELSQIAKEIAYEKTLGAEKITPKEIKEIVKEQSKLLATGNPAAKLKAAQDSARDTAANHAKAKKDAKDASDKLAAAEKVVLDAKNMVSVAKSGGMLGVSKPSVAKAEADVIKAEVDVEVAKKAEEAANKAVQSTKTKAEQKDKKLKILSSNIRQKASDIVESDLIKQRAKDVREADAKSKEIEDAKDVLIKSEREAKVAKSTLEKATDSLLSASNDLSVAKKGRSLLGVSKPAIKKAEDSIDTAEAAVKMAEIAEERANLKVINDKEKLRILSSDTKKRADKVSAEKEQVATIEEQSRLEKEAEELDQLVNKVETTPTPEVIVPKPKTDFIKAYTDPRSKRIAEIEKMPILSSDRIAARPELLKKKAELEEYNRMIGQVSRSRNVDESLAAEAIESLGGFKIKAQDPDFKSKVISEVHNVQRRHTEEAKALGKETLTRVKEKVDKLKEKHTNDIATLKEKLQDAKSGKEVGTKESAEQRNERIVKRDWDTITSYISQESFDDKIVNNVLSTLGVDKADKFSKINPTIIRRELLKAQNRSEIDEVIPTDAFDGVSVINSYVEDIGLGGDKEISNIINSAAVSFGDTMSRRDVSTALNKINQRIKALDKESLSGGVTAAVEAERVKMGKKLEKANAKIEALTAKPEPLKIKTTVDELTSFAKDLGIESNPKVKGIISDSTKPHEFALKPDKVSTIRSKIRKVADDKLKAENTALSNAQKDYDNQVSDFEVMMNRVDASTGLVIKLHHKTESGMRDIIKKKKTTLDDYQKSADSLSQRLTNADKKLSQKAALTAERALAIAKRDAEIANLTALEKQMRVIENKMKDSSELTRERFLDNHFSPRTEPYSASAMTKLMNDADTKVDSEKASIKKVEDEISSKQEEIKSKEEAILEEEVRKLTTQEIEELTQSIIENFGGIGGSLSSLREMDSRLKAINKSTEKLTNRYDISNLKVFEAISSATKKAVDRSEELISMGLDPKDHQKLLLSTGDRDTLSLAYKAGSNTNNKYGDDYGKSYQVLRSAVYGDEDIKPTLSADTIKERMSALATEQNKKLAEETQFGGGSLSNAGLKFTTPKPKVEPAKPKATITRKKMDRKDITPDDEPPTPPTKAPVPRKKTDKRTVAKVEATTPVEAPSGASSKIPKAENTPFEANPNHPVMYDTLEQDIATKYGIRLSEAESLVASEASNMGDLVIDEFGRDSKEVWPTGYDEESFASLVDDNAEARIGDKGYEVHTTPKSAQQSTPKVSQMTSNVLSSNNGTALLSQLSALNKKRLTGKADKISQVNVDIDAIVDSIKSANKKVEANLDAVVSERGRNIELGINLKKDSSPVTIAKHLKTLNGNISNYDKAIKDGEKDAASQMREFLSFKKSGDSIKAVKSLTAHLGSLRKAATAKESLAHAKEILSEVKSTKSVAPITKASPQKVNEGAMFSAISKDEIDAREVKAAADVRIASEERRKGSVPLPIQRLGEEAVADYNNLINNEGLSPRDASSIVKDTHS